MNFTHLIEEFAKIAKADSIKQEYENVVTVNLGEFELFFSYAEQQNNILLHAALGVHDENKETLACLLSMNTFFAQTKGICLGIDGTVITAQQNILLPENNAPINYEAFIKQCELFLEAAGELVALFNDTVTFQKCIEQNTATQKDDSAAPVLGQSIFC